ncbi:MAG: UvrB/UvrC motif-containing protein [Evtepia gabavorous]
MEQAAEELRFEKAAELRDRFKAIELLGKRQKVVAGSLADTDVLGLYTGEVRSGVAVLHFQEGELTGRDLEVFPTAGEPAEEILSAFLVPVLRAPGPAAPADPAALEAMEGAAHLGRLLSDQAGRQGGAGDPPAGAKADLIRMATGERRGRRCERPDHPGGADRPSCWSSLAQLLELPEPPRRIEAYDISNTGAADIVACHDGF